MKYLVLLFFIINSTLAYSQFFVGVTKRDVKTTLLKNKIIFTEDKLTDTTSRISWLNENQFQMIWILNSNDSVTKQTLISEKKNGINEFVKIFNESFVVISATEWRNYTNGIVYNIKLVNLYGDFIFSIIPLPIK